MNILFILSFSSFLHYVMIIKYMIYPVIGKLRFVAFLDPIMLQKYFEVMIYGVLSYIFYHAILLFPNYRIEEKGIRLLYPFAHTLLRWKEMTIAQKPLQTPKHLLRIQIKKRGTIFLLNGILTGSGFTPYLVVFSNLKNFDDFVQSIEKYVRCNTKNETEPNTPN